MVPGALGVASGLPLDSHARSLGGRAVAFGSPQPTIRHRQNADQSRPQWCELAVLPSAASLVGAARFYDLEDAPREHKQADGRDPEAGASERRDRESLRLLNE